MSYRSMVNMKRALCVLAILIGLMSTLIYRPNPIFICGGGCCEEAVEEFIKLAPNYIILTADEDYKDVWFGGEYKLIIVKTRKEADSEWVEREILNAGGLRITGGDQYDYYREWTNTRLSRAIAGKIGKVPIYVTSASSMILGGKYYTAEHGMYIGGNKSLITIANQLIDFPLLSKYIIDTHFTDRHREKRLKEFCEITGLCGIGIDEGAYLKIIGNTYHTGGSGKVYYY